MRPGLAQSRRRWSNQFEEYGVFVQRENHRPWKDEFERVFNGVRVGHSATQVENWKIPINNRCVPRRRSTTKQFRLRLLLALKPADKSNGLFFFFFQQLCLGGFAGCTFCCSFSFFRDEAAYHLSDHVNRRNFSVRDTNTSLLNLMCSVPYQRHRFMAPIFLFFFY